VYYGRLSDIIKNILQLSWHERSCCEALNRGDCGTRLRGWVQAGWRHWFAWSTTSSHHV